MNNKGKDLESEMSQEGFQRKVDDVVSGVHSELEMLGYPVWKMQYSFQQH
jgi:hypothetical protein